MKCSDKVSNNTLWTKTNQLPVETEIQRRKWRWISHTLRKPQASITRKALTWNPQVRRKRGRPRNTWRRDMESEVNKMGYTWLEIVTMAQRRIQWKAFTEGPFSQRVTYGDRIPSYSAFGIMPHNYDMQLRQCSYFVRRQSILASTCRINYY